MLIEERFPAAVGGKLPLRGAFLFHASAAAIPQARACELLSLIPHPLIDAECFFDNVTDIWKYEFGEPLGLSRGVLFGTCWEPVRNLVAVMDAVERYLSSEQRQRYLARLARPDAHDVAIAEFLPVVRLSHDVECDYEHRTGVGNRDADWRVRRPGQRPVVIEVKRRVADLIASVEVMMTGERAPGGRVPQPRHDATMLFRSVEKKFPKADPATVLQGAWISTALQQEADELHRAFAALDGGQVHFAILGGWDRGVAVLAKRAEDEATLLEVFGEESRRDGWEFVRR